MLAGVDPRRVEPEVVPPDPSRRELSPPNLMVAALGVGPLGGKQDVEPPNFRAAMERSKENRSGCPPHYYYLTAS